jgi:L-cysteine:1D-myo-inositol 2-amino-2-deoxy-alpha-D-glucopyranoside ligase
MKGELHLYNTASHQKERVDGQDIGIYVCGVTPYDTTHLGHAFTYVAFDVMIRYLRFIGRKVTYVRNVTDIDDDVLLRANSTGVDWKDLGDREYAKFADDMRRINNVPPEFEPRATGHIPEIIRITEGLLAKGLAYERQGAVYFEVRKYQEFGKLFRQSYDAMLEVANERGNFPADPLKRDPLDFVLWQAKKEGEPSWPSPWGEGRPGWHIECSAMGMKYLGESFAIHGGGEDLVFPHHDCEIAQSEAYTGNPFVRYWAHTAMVYCGEHKMSKSLGNMVFVSELIQKCPADAIRLHLLSHHYRQAWNHPKEATLPTLDLSRELAAALADAGEASQDEIERHGKQFLAAMADDLNTPLAIRELSVLAEGDAPARRAARTLGGQVLGMTFED